LIDIEKEKQDKKGILEILDKLKEKLMSGTVLNQNALKCSFPRRRL